MILYVQSEYGILTLLYVGGVEYSTVISYCSSVNVLYVQYHTTSWMQLNKIK